MGVLNTKKSVLLVLTLSIFATFSVVVSLNSRQAHAQAGEVCPTRQCILPGETVYNQLGGIYKVLDMRRTIEGFVFHLMFDNVCTGVWGKSCNTVLMCGENLLAERRNLAPVCTIDPAECAQLNSVPDPASVTYYEDIKTNTVAGNSLLGLSNNFSKFITQEPVPVSLALYVNDAASRVPFVGSALAQAAGPTYSGPFLDLILNIWKAARNAAYAILAIVMVFVGIMISTRKKINPQLAVSAQMALPKIVLAVVLITFSYPIGATLASFGWGVGFSFHNFVMNIDQTSGDIAGFGTGNFTAAMFYLMIFRMSTGVLVVFLAAMLCLVTIVFLLIGAARVLIVYFKMLIDIIVSPVVFALGAIPGNESSTETWFRKMLAQAISIPAIWGVIGLTLQLSLGLLVSIFDCTVEGLGYSLFVLLAVPVMYLYGMFTALRMPGIVGNWINPQKKGR